MLVTFSSKHYRESIAQASVIATRAGKWNRWYCGPFPSLISMILSIMFSSNVFFNFSSPLWRHGFLHCQWSNEAVKQWLWHGETQMIQLTPLLVYPVWTSSPNLSFVSTCWLMFWHWPQTQRNHAANSLIMLLHTVQPVNTLPCHVSEIFRLLLRPVFSCVQTHHESKSMNLSSWMSS